MVVLNRKVMGWYRTGRHLSCFGIFQPPWRKLFLVSRSCGELADWLPLSCSLFKNCLFTFSKAHTEEAF